MAQSSSPIFNPNTPSYGCMDSAILLIPTSPSSRISYHHFIQAVGSDWYKHLKECCFIRKLRHIAGMILFYRKIVGITRMKIISSSTAVIICRVMSKIRSVSGRRCQMRKFSRSIGYTLEVWVKEDQWHYTTHNKAKEYLQEWSQ